MLCGEARDAVTMHRTAPQTQTYQDVSRGEGDKPCSTDILQ
jgi:hypothetical protein